MADFIFNQTPDEQQAGQLKIEANSINKIRKANEMIQTKKGNALRKRAANAENAAWLLNELKESWE